MPGISRLIAAACTGLLSLATVVGVAAPANAAYDNQPSSTWNPDGPVHAIAVHGGRVYIGGTFTHLVNPATGEQVPRSNLAALDASTGELVRSWSADADGDVRALALSQDGNTLLAGGAFRNVDGEKRRRLVALDAGNGSVLTPWRGHAGGVVRDLLVVGDQVYVGGFFRSLSGVSERGLALLQVSNGARVDSFHASTDGKVYGLATSGGSLVVAGKYSHINGEPRRALARVNLDTGNLLPWAPQPLCDKCAKYWDVVTDAQRVYLAIGGPGGRVAAYNPTTGLNIWVTRANGDAQALALAGGLLYVGGHFNGDRSFAGQYRTQLAAVAPTNGAVDGQFAPRMYASYPGVWALAATDTALYAGGHFTGAGARQQSPFLAKFAGL